MPGGGARTAQVYSSGADQYERLILCEDYQGNLLHGIQNVIKLDGLEVVELGAGTGRLTRLLAPHVRSISAFDISLHMLEVAERNMLATGCDNWQVGVADHRQVPVENCAADLVIAGWSWSYLAKGEKCEEALQAGLVEIQRMLRPGGIAILIESMGTAVESPQPTERLGKFFSWLEGRDFQQSLIRTDYKFNTLDEAAELFTSFFGERLAAEIRRRGWVIVPEHTALCWRCF